MASDSLRFEIAVSAQQARKALAETKDLTQPNEIFRKAIWLGMQKLVQKARRERFSGKGPFPVSEKRLGVVSGRLRGGLYADETEITATGYRSFIKGRVEYFGAHEFGFRGTVQVKAHQRAGYTIKRRKSARVSKRGNAFTVRANQYSVLPGTVRAHSRDLNIPERMPMRAAIDQHAATMLTASIRSELRKLP